MPELPEVETIARGLREPLVGRQFTGVRIGWENLVARPSVEEFERGLVGQRILGVKRRGKYLVFALSSGASLIVHLRMTGRLLIKENTDELDKHDHLIFELDDGRELRFNEMRKLGRVYLVDDENEIVGELGPEPLDGDFVPADFAALLSGKRGMIKPLLLNQRFVAGIGNIYADEALFVARIHPERRADSLTTGEIERLYGAIRQVLRQGIENRGTTLSAYRDAEGREGRNQEVLQVSRNTGQPCPRCGMPIERTVVGGRGTYFCPKCQIVW
jgi:formamidopyrimidine-DNA glycosylase